MCFLIKIFFFLTTFVHIYFLRLIMSIYDSILQIPLFKGLSVEAFNKIIEKYKFDFLSYNKGYAIINAGDECDSFKFIISGSVRLEYINKKVKIKLSETITGPNNIVSNYSIGNNKYPVSVYACDDNTGILSIDKQDFISIMQEHRVVLLNYLIDLSRKSQTPFEAYNQIANDNVRAKFAFWILYFTSYNSSDIVINAKLRDIYMFFGAQRSVFNMVLDEMKELGIINFSSKEICILDRNLLRLYYRQNCEG